MTSHQNVSIVLMLQIIAARGDTACLENDEKQAKTLLK